MSGLFDLSGRSIVVTGGAGHLGSAICKALADSGANVLCLSTRYLDPCPKGVITRICNVRDEQGFKGAVLNWKRPDGLVNCAVRAPRRPDLNMTAAQFNEAISGILTHYFTCSTLCAKYMDGGSIVNLASMWGLVSPDTKTYLDLKNEPSFAMSAAAGGILGLTRYMATQLAQDNIRVNALVPGWFPKKRGPDRPDYLAEIEKRTPMGRIGKPEEIVGAAIFLLSQASSFMTGQQLVVDGGYSIQ